MNNLIKDIPKTSELEKKLLQARIKELEYLPLPSCTMLELSTILKTEPNNQEAIANCFAHDHVMLAQMLRIFYRSFPGVNPNSPLDAVAMLPLDRIHTLTYAPHILETFGEREEQEWNHAYTCRILMESILDDNGIDDPRLIRAAHLHDIGKNVFRDWSPKKYKLVEKHAESSREVPLYKLENAVLQIDHAHAGAELLKAWGFSEEVWQVVAQHHNHDDDPPENYVFETALLQFVNYIDCKVRGIPCEPPSQKLMKKARIAEIDEEGYLGAQKALIERLRANDNEAIRKSVIAKMVEAEKQAQEAAAAALAAEAARAEVQEEAAETPQEVIPVEAPAPAAAEAPQEALQEEAAKKEENGIAFSPRFRSASLSISAGNGFTPAAAPATPEESLSSALNAEDNIMDNPEFDPEQYSSSAVPASTAKKEEELLKKMGLK